MKSERAPKQEIETHGAAGNIEAKWKSPLESEIENKKTQLKDVDDELCEQERNEQTTLRR